MRPDIRDAHIYGGLLVFAIAGWAVIGWVAPMMVGAMLVYLGVWRMR